MPSVSKKQARAMRFALHNKAFRKKMGIKKSVAADFVRADKRKGRRR